jgi:short-subunit dehydrogenase
VINISSSFGLGVTPMFAAYLATKHYVTGFTEGLCADLAGTEVVVTQVCPGPVRTEFEQTMGNETGAKGPRSSRSARSTALGLRSAPSSEVERWWCRVSR